jgi:Tfp pilus assembly protein PilV
VTVHHPPTPPPPRRAKRGFTILEVAMATAVMSLGIATSIIAMQQGFKFLDVARGTTLASQILQSDIERLRMMSWEGITDMANKTDSEAPMPPGSPRGVEMLSGDAYFSTPSLTGNYIITRTVVLEATRPADVALITVSVQWRTYDGRVQTRSFQAKYIRNGLYDYYYTSAAPL